MVSRPLRYQGGHLLPDTGRSAQSLWPRFVSKYLKQNTVSETNICPGSICCGFGCCPDSSFKCNADFSCIGPDGVVINPAPDPDPNPSPTTQPVLSTGIGEPPPDSQETGSGTLSQPVPTSDVVVIGTQTVTIPVMTSPTTFITLDHTFTLAPPSNSPPEQDSPSWTTVETGNATLFQFSGTTTVMSLGSTSLHVPAGASRSESGSSNPGPDPDSTTSALVIDESQTLTLSSAAQETAATTEEPSESPTITLSGGQQQPPTTFPSQETTALAPVAIIDETRTLTLPSPAQETTVTTEGQTFTLLPGGPPTITISEGHQQSPVSSATSLNATTPTSTVAVVGSETFTYLPVSEERTVTSEDYTATLTPAVDTATTAENPPNQEPTQESTQEPTQEPVPMEEPDGTNDPLPSHTQWPAGAVLEPVETEVENPQPSDDDDDDEDNDSDDNDDDDDDDDVSGDNTSAILPCKLWFFSVSGVSTFVLRREESFAKPLDMYQIR